MAAASRGIFSGPRRGAGRGVTRAIGKAAVRTDSTAVLRGACEIVGGTRVVVGLLSRRWAEAVRAGRAAVRASGACGDIKEPT